MLRILKDQYSPLALFLLAAIFVVLAPVFWAQVGLQERGAGAGAYVGQDIYEKSLPNLAYGFGRLRQGEIPLWNPYQFCGVPFQASPATGLFQPLNALFLVLPPERAFAMTALLCLVLMGACCALFLRSLELRLLSCIFGGMIYAFSGASAAAMNRPELAAVLAWAPLLFWASRELQREHRLAVAVLGGIAGAGCLLSGGYALSLGMLLVWLPYALLGAFHKHALEGRRPLRALLSIAAVLLLALGLSAVQWLPALRWSTGLAEPEALWRLEVAALFPQHLRALAAQWLSPRDGTLPKAAYVALGALLLAPGAIFLRNTRLDAAYFLAVLIGAIALALLPGPLFGILPQGAWWFAAAFALAVLAGLGAEKLFTVTRDAYSPYVWLPIALLLGVAAAILYAGTVAARGLVLAYFALLLPYLLLRARWLAMPTAFALTLFLFVDCCLSNVNFQRHPLTGGPAVPPDAAQMLKQAQEQAVQGRSMFWAPGASPVLPVNFGMMAVLSLAGGSHIPLDPAQHAWREQLGLPQLAATELPEEAHPELLNFMAAQVLLLGEEAAFSVTDLERRGVQLDLVRARAKLRLYRNTTALPRAHWVPQWYPVTGVDAAIDALTGPGFDAMITCTIDADAQALQDLEAMVPKATPPAPQMPEADPFPTTSKAQIMDSQPERVVVQVEASQPGLLVLADTFAEGWRATIDDQPAPILRANGLFRGVAVPAGAHLVVFEYVPVPFWAGLAVSLGTLALCTLLGIVKLFR